MDNLNSIIDTCNNTMDMININDQEDLDVDTILSLFVLVNFFNNENRWLKCIKIVNITPYAFDH